MITQNFYKITSMLLITIQICGVVWEKEKYYFNVYILFVIPFHLKHGREILQDVISQVIWK